MSASIAASIPFKRNTDSSLESPPRRAVSGEAEDEPDDEPEDESEDESESEELFAFTGVVPLRDCALARVLGGIQDPLNPLFLSQCAILSIEAHFGFFRNTIGDEIQRHARTRNRAHVGRGNQHASGASVRSPLHQRNGALVEGALQVGDDDRDDESLGQRPAHASILTRLTGLTTKSRSQFVQLALTTFVGSLVAS